MKFNQLPPGSQCLDVDGIPVVRLPDKSLLSFEAGKGVDGGSLPYPNTMKAELEGDHLSMAEFSDWLVSGKNRFDR